ncbi:MAG: TetR/AcrR family transcriptional regulator [Actinomycetota bacterium]
MPTQAERRSTTRRAIASAAFDAFVRSGSTVVALDEIARDAGVTKGTILYHYESRAGLLSAVAIRLFSDIEERATRGTDVDATTYVTRLLEAQTEPVARVLFLIGDELLRLERLDGVDPFLFLRQRLDELGTAGSSAVQAGAILQFGRQLAFGRARPDEITGMVAALGL